MNIDLDPVADLAAAIRELAAVLTKQNAGACPSVWEFTTFTGRTDHHVCRHLNGHNGIHRSDDGDARWTDDVDGAHTLGVDR